MEKTMGKPRSTHVGQIFGRLTIVSEAGKVANGAVLWNCQCTCGNTKHIRGSDLNSGRVNSCGCLLAETKATHYLRAFRTHGMTASSTYIVWHNLKARCSNPNEDSYHRYGGRGISYDPEWEKFENFLADMGEKPAGLSLDRIDNNGNYCKANCRWVSMKVQSSNTSKSVRVLFAGKEYTLQELADMSGQTKGQLAQRLRNSWPLEEAVHLPSGSRPSHRVTTNPVFQLYKRENNGCNQ